MRENSHQINTSLKVPVPSYEHKIKKLVSLYVHGLEKTGSILPSDSD